MSAFVDTNVLVRHLTGDPPSQAARATRYLRRAETLLLADLILAEVAYVLESYYEVARGQVAEALRAILAFRAIRVVDAELLHRAVEVYEVHRLDFADAYSWPAPSAPASARSPRSTARSIGSEPFGARNPADSGGKSSGLRWTAALSAPL